MKTTTVSLLLTTLLHTVSGQADSVLEPRPDTLAGKGFGGASGFMIGAVAGGPIGALIGAGLGGLPRGAGERGRGSINPLVGAVVLGGLTGSYLQQTTGLSATAYRVRRADGSEVTVRSPNQNWSSGDRVLIVDNRLVAAHTAGQ